MAWKVGGKGGATGSLAGVALVVLRVSLGIFMIAKGLDKLGWFVHPDLLAVKLNAFLAKATPANRWWVTLLIPGVAVFARLVPFGELAAGASLIVGRFTRLAAILAFLMILNFHLATGALLHWDFERRPGVSGIGRVARDCIRGPAVETISAPRQVAFLGRFSGGSRDCTLAGLPSYFPDGGQQMRRLLFLAVLLASAVLAVESRLAAQKQAQLFISLMGPDGTPVADLQAGDVSISEDGVACKTLKVEPIDWPIKLQILVDNGKANTNPINRFAMPRDAVRKSRGRGDGAVYDVAATAPHREADGRQGAAREEHRLDCARRRRRRVFRRPVRGSQPHRQGQDAALSRHPHGRIGLRKGQRDGQGLSEDAGNHSQEGDDRPHHRDGGRRRHRLSGGGAQTEIAQPHELSGGRYENITTRTGCRRCCQVRQKIAKRGRQRHQFRHTRTRRQPKLARISATIGKPGTRQF
jgi:uncharacterized membrane protein YphA (DoxX/SURF4 family)